MIIQQLQHPNSIEFSFSASRLIVYYGNSFTRLTGEFVVSAVERAIT